MINNISLRDWFAGQAIAGSAFSDYSAVNVAKRADEIADAMMARRGACIPQTQTDGSKTDDFVMPVVFDRDALRLAADGDISKLDSAFAWATSLRGVDHWRDIANGRKPLSEADKEYLEEVLARTERKAEP